MTATAAAIKRLDDLFQNIRLDEQTKGGGGGGGTSSSRKSRDGTADRVHFNPIVITKDCDIHGVGSGRRNSSSVNSLRRGSIGATRRDSVPTGLNATNNGISAATKRRDSLVLGSSTRDSLFGNGNSVGTGAGAGGGGGFSASTLRKDSSSSSSPTTGAGISLGSLKRNVNFKKDSFSTLAAPSSKREVFSTLGANGKLNGNLKRDYVNNHSSLRKDSLGVRRFSTDSLDSLRRNSWDPTRRESSGSSAGFDDPIWEENSNNFTDEVK